MITSKNGSLTEKCRLFETQIPPKHTEHFLEALNDQESLQLLSWHAFGHNEPNEGDKEESMKVVRYCKGHPLALKVLGCSLRSEDAAWDDILESLGKETNPDITKVLKVSFDTLPSEKDKELFKHIACLFVGEDRKFTEDILKACGICKSSGIKILINRCLLTVGSSDKLMMHQLLQDMGKDIVRQESPKKPWKRSILLDHEECLDVLQNRQQTTTALEEAQEKSALPLVSYIHTFTLTEIQHHYKTQALSEIDKEVLHRLGCTDIEYLNHCGFSKAGTSGVYDLPGRMLPPAQISRVTEAGPSRIEIKNLTKNSSWTYQPIMYAFPEYNEFEYGEEVVVVWLSYWVFGKNEFEDGDEVSIHFSVKYHCLDDSACFIGYGGKGPDYANVREYVKCKTLGVKV
ncbi:hypothetical protein L1987_83702 [Smallanthus sonchifolius]|uniref:Uncharacterized protein n=1 Tax=Smallanthus sonchifolius TaxID=185202 RepID=A0ACB8YCL6_9ASTR|nr:hypothetical protein L1987_83702 [Smallanthus sonchifolius]